MSLVRATDLRLPLESEGSPAQTLLHRAALAAAASLFVGLCAHIAIPVPFTPVPFTLQPFAVVLVGMLLGPVTGFAALVAYLLEGAAGLPVFTPGGLGGVAQLMGPTGGFLMAYPAAAALAGVAARLLPRAPRFATLFAGGMAAMALIFASGVSWFAHVTHVSTAAALSVTVLPFALSDAVKVCAAAGIASAWQRRKNRA